MILDPQSGAGLGILTIPTEVAPPTAVAVSSSSVALVHDYLLVMRGAERTFAAIAECWPEAPIYTLLYDEEGTEGRFADREVHTSYLQKLGVGQRRVPCACCPPSRGRHVRLPLDGYDLVISSSSAFAHGVRAGSRRSPRLLLPQPVPLRLVRDASARSARWLRPLRPAFKRRPCQDSRERSVGLTRRHPLRGELGDHPGAHRQLLGSASRTSFTRRSRWRGFARGASRAVFPRRDRAGPPQARGTGARGRQARRGDDPGGRGGPRSRAVWSPSTAERRALPSFSAGSMT